MEVDLEAVIRLIKLKGEYSVMGFRVAAVAGGRGAIVYNARFWAKPKPLGH